MATCRDVIKRALRMLGVLERGSEPDADEAADALESLRGLYLAPGVLGTLTPVVITDDYTAGENERILNVGATATVTLPETVTGDDGAERAPLNRAVVVVAGTNPGTFVYDADEGAWMQADALALDSDAPFSTGLSEPLSARLAVSLASDYGLAPTPAVAALAASYSLSVSLASGEFRDEPAYY